MLLLAAVQTRPMHGYAIIEHVREASAGQFEYAEGTIYPALRHLELERLVARPLASGRGAPAPRLHAHRERAPGSSAPAADHGSASRQSVQAVLDHALIPACLIEGYVRETSPRGSRAAGKARSGRLLTELRDHLEDSTAAHRRRAA